MRYGSQFRSWIGLDSLMNFRVTALAFDCSGRLLASGHGDGNIILWNVATQQKFRTLLGHTTRVTDREWSPEIETLAWSPRWDTSRQRTKYKSEHPIMENEYG